MTRENDPGGVLGTKVVITEHEKARRGLGLSATAMARALGLVDHSYWNWN